MDRMKRHNTREGSEMRRMRRFGLCLTAVLAVGMVAAAALTLIQFDTRRAKRPRSSTGMISLNTQKETVRPSAKPAKEHMNGIPWTKVPRSS